MPKREIDKRKTRKALRKLRRAAERASGEDGPGLTDWEKDFVHGVSGRLEKYGSAFRDPGKGRLEEALSQRQAEVTRIIGRKSRRKKAGEPVRTGPDKIGKAPLKRSTLKRKRPLKPQPGTRARDVNGDLEPEDSPSSEPTPAQKRVALRIIPGGKDC